MATNQGPSMGISAEEEKAIFGDTPSVSSTPLGLSAEEEAAIFAPPPPKQSLLSQAGDFIMGQAESMADTPNMLLNVVPDAISRLPSAINDAGVSLAQGITALPGMMAVIPDAIARHGAETRAIARGEPSQDLTASTALAELGYNPKTAQDALAAQYSDSQLASNARQEQANKEGFTASLGNMATDPQQLVSGFMRSAPSMLAGGLVGRAYAGATGVSPVVAGAVGEGAVSGLSTAQQTQQDQGGKLPTDLQLGISAISGILVGGITVVGGKVAAALGIPDINTLMAGGTSVAAKKEIWKRALQVAAGVGHEGGLEEGPQSAIEQIAQNLAEEKPWSQGVDAAVAQGMVLGGIIGGAVAGNQGVVDDRAAEADAEMKKHELDKIDMQSKVDANEAIAQLPEEAQAPLKQAAEDAANAEAMAGIDVILASLDIAPLSEQDKAEAVAEAEAEKAAVAAKDEALKHPDLMDGQEDAALSLYRQNTREGEENTNDTSVVPLMKQRVTNSVDPSQLGKTLARTKLTPGIAVGVSADGGTSDLFPAEYRQAAVDTATWMMQKLKMNSTKVVLKFEALSGDSTASVDVHKNGTYVINPSHLTRFGDSSQYSQIAQVQAGSSLAHEIGHIFTLEQIQGGMTAQHRAEFDALPDTALLSESLIAAQAPEIQGVLLEYNAMKARVLDGSMGSQEFIDTWLGPSKSGRGMNTKDGRQTFGQAVAGEFRSAGKMSAKDFAAALGGNILSAHEYLAEQMARYAHDRKLLEQAPLGTQQFFGRALAALREFFASLKKEGIIKAGTSFTAYVDGITGVGKKKVSRPRKSKAKSAPAPADAPAPAVLKAKKAKAPKVVQELPTAFRPLSLIAAETKAGKVAKVADALLGVDKLEVASARVNALKVIKANAMLQKVKAEDPEAYKEMLGYVNSGQFESFREMAEDYIGFKAAQKLTFNDTDPTANPFKIDFEYSGTKVIEEKAPPRNTCSAWMRLFSAWENNGTIKKGEFAGSGLKYYLSRFVQEGMDLYMTKEEILEKFTSGSGPFKVQTYSGTYTKFPHYRARAFLQVDGRYTNIDNYHEIVFLADPSLPASNDNRHFTQAKVNGKGHPLFWMRIEFLVDALGRKVMHIHELQSDLAAALRQYGLEANEASTDGQLITVGHRDSEGNLTEVSASRGIGGTPMHTGDISATAQKEAIGSYNLRAEPLKTMQERTGSLAGNVWMKQALRYAMRLAVNNKATLISIATEAQQVEQSKTSSISWEGNMLHVSNAAGTLAFDGVVNSLEDTKAALLRTGWKAAVIPAQAAAIWEQIAVGVPTGQTLSHAEAFNATYGNSQGKMKNGAPSMIWSVLQHKSMGDRAITKKQITQTEVVGEMVPAFEVDAEWGATPVRYFDTDPSQGTGPEFEKMTRELDRTGLAGEMQNAGRKMAAFGSRMANAVVTIQQLAFANKYIAGLNYYKDQTIAFQSYKASLEISAVSIAHEWSKLGKEQFAKMANLLEAEYAEGVHYATLQKNPQTKKWEMVASPRFVEEAKKHGVDEQTAALALRIKQSILARQNSLENTLFTQALLRFGPRSKRARVAVAEIMETMDAIRSQPHLPQSRFGDFGAMVYEVTFDSGGKEVKILKHKEFFQTEGARDDAVRKLQKAVGTGHLVTAYNYRAGMSRFGGVPAGVLSTIAAELELTEEQQNQVLSMLDTAKESKALRQYSKKLAGVTGRNKDLLRNYADYMQADANVQAKMRFGSEFKRALTSVANDIAILDAAQVKGPEYAAQRRKMESILQYMESHKDYMMNPQNEMSSIKTVVVLWQLWGVIKTAVANLTALVAVLADAQAHFGNIKGTAAVGKAGFDTVTLGMNSVLKNAKQLLKVSGSESKVLNAEDDWAVTKAQVEGVLDQTFAAQLGDFSEAGVLQRLGGSQVNNMWQHTKRMGLVPLHMIEVSTRYTAMLTKFRLYRAAGLDANEAYKNAAEETRLIMGDSTRINRPPFMRGKAANFTIYYGFTQLMMYLFSGAYERGYSERAIELNAKGYQITPRKNALGGMTTRMWLMFLLLGGAEGLPGEADIRAIIRFIAQKMFGTDYDLNLEVRKWVMDFNTHIDDLGIQLDPSTVLHGITHNIGGFDLSGSVGFGRIIPGLATLGDSGATGVDTALAGAGPLGGFVSGMVRALTGGQPTLSLQVAPAMPTIVKNQIEVYNWAKDGVRFHSGGKVVRDLETGELRNLETGELIGKSLGFNPTAVAEAREMHFMQKDAAMFWAEKHSVVMGNVAEAVLQNDREAIADSLKALTKFNKNAPPAMRINQAALMQSIKMSAKKAAYDTAGVPMQKAQQAIAVEVKSTFPRAN